MDKMRLDIGKRYTATSRHAYRTGDPFEVLSVAILPTYDRTFTILGAVEDLGWRYVYVIRYDDREIECIPVEEEGGYEIVDTHGTRIE